MLRIAFGIFIVLHGLVHLFYFGQSQRLFELQDEMVWPEGSWAFSRLLGERTTRSVASVCCLLGAIGFVVAGIGVFARQEWWQPAIVVSAVLSSVIFVLFWDGKLQRLANHGFLGILINVSILVAVLVLQWPDLGF